jgi:hypothetical protein
MRPYTEDVLEGLLKTQPKKIRDKIKILLEIKLNKLNTAIKTKTNLNTPDSYQGGFQEFKTFHIVVAKYIQLKPKENYHKLYLFVKSQLKDLRLSWANNYIKNYKDNNHSFGFVYLWTGLTGRYSDPIREAKIFNSIIK